MTLLLGLFGLFSTRPWESDSLVPKLEVPPGLGAALGDAVEVLPAGSPSVASAEVAPGGPQAHVAGPVALSGGGASTGGSLLAVSPGRPVVSAAPTGTPAPTEPASPPPPVPVEAEPVAAAPQPVSATQPAVPSPPVVAAVGGGNPGTSGVTGSPQEPEAEPEQGCEGDEYLIVVGASAEAPEGESADLEIVIQRFGADGSESEFELEGDLDAVEELTRLLTAEGNCVQTVFEDPHLGEAPAATLP